MYKGVDYDVPTVLTGTYWIVKRICPRISLSNGQVRLQQYGSTHKIIWRLKVMKPNESAIAGIDVPLHPGAEKFWKETGLDHPRSDPGQEIGGEARSICRKAPQEATS